MKLLLIIALITIGGLIPSSFAYSEQDTYVTLTDVTQSHESITVEIKALIPVKDFVTVKLINSEGWVPHMIWYKVQADSLTTFDLTFTDIDKLNIRGNYTLQVEYDGITDSKNITLN